MLSTLRFLVVAATIVALAAIAPTVAASPRAGGAPPRAGELRVTKECSEYTGAAGSFCTFTSSNIRAIAPGDRIYYRSAAGATSLDSDVVIVTRSGVAAGHCTLDFMALPGSCRFSGGTGTFAQFTARVSVGMDASGLWHWDGWYRFGRRD